MRASLRNTLRGEARTLAGLVIGGLIVGGAAVAMMRTAGEWAEPTPAEARVRLGKAGSSALKSVVGRQVTRAIAGRGTATPTTAAKSPTTPGAKTVNPASRTAAASTAQRLTVSPVPKPTAVGPHVDPGPAYQYNALGRRDPFLPLVGTTYVDIDAPPELGGLRLVGVVWGTEDRFGLCEDARGNSFVLRPGDKVMNGVVQGLQRDALQVSVTTDGQTQTVTIPLTRKGDSDANR